MLRSAQIQAIVTALRVSGIAARVRSDGAVDDDVLELWAERLLDCFPVNAYLLIIIDREGLTFCEAEPQKIRS